MIFRLGQRLTLWAQRVVPDPFVLALALTLVVGLMGVLMTESSAWQMVGHWQKGFWDLLKFGMQMALILVTGHVVAVSRPVHRGVTALAHLPRTGAGAAMMVCAVTLVAAFINWGLGLVVGALLARDTALELRCRGVPVHYPLLGAAGYSGLVIWHGGLSGSAPLKVASANHEFVNLSGVIPVTETLGSPLNIAITLGLFATLPLLFRLLHPKSPDDIQPVDGWLGAMEIEPRASLPNTRPRSPVEWIENHPAPAWLAGGVGLAWLVSHLRASGFAGLDLDTVIWTFLFAGLCLQGSLRRFIEAFAEGTRSTSGVLLQFPFYAGIMGMMKFSGLVGVLSSGFVAVSSAATFPLLGMLSAGLVNLFVPSGGGQWAVQGPILLEAAQQLNVPASKAVMALAYGDEWTNMVQPFWALPLLGITGLKAGDIMGYGVLVLAVAGAVFVGGLVVF